MAYRAFVLALVMIAFLWDVPVAMASASDTLIRARFVDTAASLREKGECYARNIVLAQSSEDLEYLKRWVRVRGATGDVDADYLRRAQRLLDEEKRQPCVPNAESQEFLEGLAALPPSTGRVRAMDTKTTNDGERLAEAYTAFYIVLTDGKCDLETAARWLKSMEEVVRTLKLRRDAALALGEFSSSGNFTLSLSYANMRYLYDIARWDYDRVRVFCAKASQQQFQPTEVLPPPPTPGREKDEDVEWAEPTQLPGHGRYLEHYDPDEAQHAMLEAHNEARREWGVAPVMWDPYLAAGAHDYAQELVGTGQIKHSPRDGREEQRENLLITNRGYRSPTEMIEVFSDEGQFYAPGIYPDVSTDGNWYTVSHFTQVVWPWTGNVGCAISSDAQWDYTVCRYAAPGNRDGDPLYLINFTLRAP